MGSITALGIVLLILMIIVGGKQGITSFLSMVVNFGILFFTIVLIAFHLPPITVTIVSSIILLSITIFGAVPVTMPPQPLFKHRLWSLS